MKSETWFEEKIAQFENDLMFLTEEKILEFNEKVVMKMAEKGINRTGLANRLGFTKPFVTKLLNGNPNMTIKTMVHIANALDCSLHLDICHKWVKPKTLCLLSNENYKKFHLKAEEFEYASAA